MGAGDAAFEGTSDWLEIAMSSVSVSAGIPRPASTAARAYAPSPSEMGLVGNPHPGAEAAASPAPAQFSLSYPTPVGRKTVVFAWHPGRRIRDYLRERNLIATWLRYRSIDKVLRRKVRLNEPAYAGQVVVLQHANARAV